VKISAIAEKNPPPVDAGGGWVCVFELFSYLVACCLVFDCRIGGRLRGVNDPQGPVVGGRPPMGR